MPPPTPLPGRAGGGSKRHPPPPRGPGFRRRLRLRLASPRRGDLCPARGPRGHGRHRLVSAKPGVPRGPCQAAPPLPSRSRPAGTSALPGRPDSGGSPSAPIPPQHRAPRHVCTGSGLGISWVVPSSAGVGAGVSPAPSPRGAGGSPAPSPRCAPTRREGQRQGRSPPGAASAHSLPGRA